MEYYDVIQQRRSIRNYLPTPVPGDMLERILEAGRLAPSWCNRQCWRFIVVKDEIKRRQLADVLGENTAADAMRQAPLALLVCAEPTDSARYEGKPYFLVDTAIAMEHIVLAATAEGLGTCWVGAFSEYSVRNLFGIPREVNIIAMTPLGFPIGDPGAQSRKPLSEIVFYDAWKYA